MVAFRACFVGDSITAGVGDVQMRGWPSRLAEAEIARGHSVVVYNLGIGGNTSAQVRERWRGECERRLPETIPGRLVFAFGLPDLVEEIGVGTRVPLEDSVDNARAVLAEAKEWLPTLMIGPIPTVDDMQPYMLPSGAKFHLYRDRTAEQSRRYAEVCNELDVPYLDLFTPFATDAAWDREQRAYDGTHTTADGYAMIATKVQNWPAWQSWLS